MNNSVYRDDVYSVINDFSFDWKKFKGKSFLITGATGLIGSLLVNVLSYADIINNLDLKLYLLIRNEEKANKIFGDRVKSFNLIINSIENFKSISDNIDYIIHAASQTSSKGFVEKPVETFKTALNGTMNLLDIAKEKDIEKFIFLSTMEVYGTPKDDVKITENTKLSVLSSNIRNCYPISKIACENLCCDYSSEFGLNVSVLRLTQTFGPGVNYMDGRVFAEFARCAIEERDIILKTKGETKRSYLYTTDAITAILTVLISDDKKFEIYNVANEETYCTIYDMARLVADVCAKGKIKVKIEEVEESSMLGYAPTLCMNLDAGKLKNKSWSCKKDIKSSYINLIEYMRTCNEK